MVGKRIKLYRLKAGLTAKKLAEMIGVTPTTISHYEKDKRSPDLNTLRKLVAALGVKLGDLLSTVPAKHAYHHAEFRKQSRLTKSAQELVCETAEDYFDRLFSVMDQLGGDLLPPSLPCHELKAVADPEVNAQMLRKYLGLPCSGPVRDLVHLVESKGVLVFLMNYDDSKFSGMNGMADGRPFVIINQQMTAERQRSTLAHELAHLFFRFEPGMEEKELEMMMTAISGAFLFPKEDAFRVLGRKRVSIVAEEYGISMLLLVKRAEVLGIITESLYQSFMIQASQHGWRTNEPSRIPQENTQLLEQFVRRAVGEEAITMSKGAELLHIPYADMAERMTFAQEV